MAVLRGKGDSGEQFAERVPGGYMPSIKQFYYDVAIAGSEAVIGSLTAIIDPEHIVYGSDWPYVRKEIIAEQVINFSQMPQFAGDRLEAMERKNSLRLFKRFSSRSARDSRSVRFRCAGLMRDRVPRLLEMEPCELLRRGWPLHERAAGVWYATITAKRRAALIQRFVAVRQV